MKHTRNHIRILLISPYFAPHIGGSQRYMEELYVHLRNQFPHVSVDVLTYNTDHKATKEHYRGLTIFRLPCWEILPGQFTLPNPITLCIILYKLAQNKYDFVHTHIRFFDATWWAWIYARMIRAKSIFTEHVANRPVHEHSTVELIAGFVDKTIAGWAMPRYDIITVTNKSAQNFLHRAYQMKQRIHLIYGGVDTSYFTPIHKSKRVIPILQKHIKSTDTVITFIGRLIWAKGAIKLYHTYKNLMPKLKRNVYVVIAGSGPESTNLQKQIQQDNLQDRVVFLGPLDTKQVRQTLQATDIFVHPSRHNEGFPNVILEAGAIGNYVIATDVAGVKEIILPSKTGSLISPANNSDLTHALLWAIHNTKKRGQRAKRLRKYVQTHFDWRTISVGYMHLLENNLK